MPQYHCLVLGKFCYEADVTSLAISASVAVKKPTFHRALCVVVVQWEVINRMGDIMLLQTTVTLISTGLRRRNWEVSGGEEGRKSQNKMGMAEKLPKTLSASNREKTKHLKRHIQNDVRMVSTMFGHFSAVNSMQLVFRPSATKWGGGPALLGDSITWWRDGRGARPLRWRSVTRTKEGRHNVNFQLSFVIFCRWHHITWEQRLCTTFCCRPLPVCRGHSQTCCLKVLWILSCNNNWANAKSSTGVETYESCYQWETKVWQSMLESHTTWDGLSFWHWEGNKNSEQNAMSHRVPLELSCLLNNGGRNLKENGPWFLKPLAKVAIY